MTGTLLLTVLVPVLLSGPGRCGTCHPDIRVLFESSIHAAEGAVCTDCHGGNPDTLVVEQAHRGKFVARPARKNVPKLCARCHSDIVRMKPYNLPADQFALYQTSRHGQLLARGDERVAVCTDCHGVHDILSPRDAASPVAPRNIPQTCGHCHGDRELMGKYGKSGDAYAEYMRSVHAAALLERGNLRAPECSRCHGVHGATPPGVGDVDKVCGSCHEPSRHYFLDSPHFPGMKNAGLPECASCHGNHAIEPAELELIDSVCANCHSETGAEVELGHELKVLVTSAQEQIISASDLIREAEAAPLDVEDYKARLEEARTYLAEALPAMHSLSMKIVERFARSAQSIGKEIASELHEKLEGRKIRRLGLVVFWFYTLLTIALLTGARHRHRREAPR